MFDFQSIIELMRLEPGHGLIQSVLLLMIWWQSKSLKQEMTFLRQLIGEVKLNLEKRFESIETRVLQLEKGAP